MLSIYYAYGRLVEVLNLCATFPKSNPSEVLPDPHFFNPYELTLPSYMPHNPYFNLLYILDIPRWV